MSDKVEADVNDGMSDVEVGDVDDENFTCFRELGAAPAGRTLFANKFLPEVERESVAAEEVQCEENIIESLKDLLLKVQESGEVDVKSFGKVMKLVNQHVTLKYHFSTKLRVLAVQVMLHIFNMTSVSLNWRTKALNILTIMLNKKWARIDVAIDWRPFWTELISFLNREKRHDVVAAETGFVQFVTKLALFLQTSRDYLIMSESDDVNGFGNVYQTAMQKLQDLAQPSCFEGPLLLMTCLPTSWAHYDEVLPIWLDMWLKFSQNSAWDLCWTVIFSRAIKHSRSFDWTPWLPFLLSKLKDLLQLPTQQSGHHAHAHNTFPRSFPKYYGFAYSHIKDVDQHILLKLSKIITRLMLADQTPVSAELSSITIPHIAKQFLEDHPEVSIVGFKSSGGDVSSSTKTVLLFLHSLRPFIHSSNNGHYVVNISVFLSCLSRTAGRIVGSVIGDKLSGVDTKLSAISVNSALFMSGVLLSLSLDGLFSKNMRVNRTLAMCFKHLITLQPDVLHIVTHLCLQPLTAEGNSQSFQSTVSLMTLSTCARAGFFPQPLLLQYLPVILKASLESLEASDTPRAMMALDLLSTVFSWLPISKSHSIRVPSFASYMELLQTDGERPYLVPSAVQQQHLDSVYQLVTTEWLAPMLDKMCNLISSEEQKIEGVTESPLSSAVGFFVSMFFQAIEDVDTAFVDEMRTKLLQFVLRSAPSHTDKSCAKILEYFIGCFPQELPVILTALLTADVLSAGLPADKLAFRLRVIGGCLRQSQGYLPLDRQQQLVELLSNPAVMYHEDAKVRTSAAKIAKDVLKGGAASYPVRVLPSRCAAVGAPNVLRDGDVQWYVPSKHTAQQSVQVLKALVAFAQQQIGAILSESEATSSPFKKCEDIVGSCMMLLQHAVRGAAELIAEAPNGSVVSVVRTGREELLALLDPEDSQYVYDLRRNVLQFAVDMHEQLSSATHPTLMGLRNNELIVREWIKLVNVLLLRRTAFCKDVEKLRKWIEVTATQARISVCYGVFKRLKRANQTQWTVDQSLQSGSMFNCMRSTFYWRRHDWNMNSLCGSMWLQHCSRSAQYGRSSFQYLLRTRGQNEGREVLPMRSINALLELTNHQYDDIRPHARKAFGDLTPFLGGRLNEIIASLLAVLESPTTTYTQSASTLVILKQTTVMRRLQSDVQLKCRFLLALSNVHVSAGTIAEEDKREKVHLALSDAFVKYSQGWSVSARDLQHEQAVLLPRVLTAFGLSKVPSGGLAPEPLQSSGLRFDAIQSYILLHVMGGSLIAQNGDDWNASLANFCIKQLCENHGQPCQVVARCALYRFVELISQSPQMASDRSWFAVMRSSLDPLDASNSLKSFLLGLVRSSVAVRGSADDSARNLWSRGIQELLGGLALLSTVKPRSYSHRRSEQNFYSGAFSYELAGAIATMCQVGLLPIVGLSQGSAVAALEQLFNHQLQTLATVVGDNELRLVNTLRAEFFGGVARFLFTTGSVHLSEEVDSWLRVYLTAQMEQVSTEFLRDWQEALYFAFEAATNPAALSRSSLVNGIVLQFQDTITKSEATEVAGAALEEGFNKFDKTIMLLNSALNGLCVANFGLRAETSSLATRVLEVVLREESCLVLPYRSSRSELTAVLSHLADFLPDSDVVRLISGRLHRFLEVVGDSAENNLQVCNTVETVCVLLTRLLNRLQMRRALDAVPYLLPFLAVGIRNSKADVVKQASDSLLLVVAALRTADRVPETLTATLSELKRCCSDESWRVREFFVRAASVIMLNNWVVLDTQQRLQIKDILADGTKDRNSNVQEVAREGMVAYLSLKTDSELETIAAAYNRNSETLLAREKARRKQRSDASATDQKADPAHIQTLHMISCVLRCRPYDVPSFIPPLLDSFLRHNILQEGQVIVLKTVQLFKRTHQDRWEDFKRLFSSQQLESLQGAGAAHYFA